MVRLGVARPRRYGQNSSKEETGEDAKGVNAVTAGRSAGWQPATSSCGGTEHW